MDVFRATSSPPGTTPGDFTGSAQLYADSPNRILYAISGAHRWLAAFDLDDYSPLGTGAAVSGVLTAVHVDPGTRSIMVGLRDPSSQLSRVDVFVPAPAGLSKAVSIIIPSVVEGESTVGTQIIGLARAPKSAVAWALLDRPSLVANAQGGGVFVAEFSLVTSTVHWVYRSERCAASIHAHPQIPAALGFVDGGLLFGCGNPVAADVGRPPVPRGVGRLALKAAPEAGTTPKPGAFELFEHAGDFSRGDSHFDPVAGRLMLSAYAPVTGGTTVYAFDGRARAFVGGVSAGRVEVTQSGIDPVRGRAYLLSGASTAGLVLADLRPTPVSQGANVPALHARSGQAPTSSHIAVDAARRRIFLKYSGSQEFVVVEDRLPSYVPLAGSDPDANTIDVDEAPGKTDRDYSGSAQAFGSWSRQIGGLQALLVNILADPGTYPVSAGTREHRGAYLSRLTLANDEASASATTADVDRANSKSDIGRTKPPDELDPEAEPVAEWPFEDARCIDFGNSPSTDEDDTGRAIVECDAAEQRADAQAASVGTDVSGSLIGDSSVEAETRLDAEKGMFTKVIANSSGISLAGGRLKIGEVEHEAQAWARGAPGTTGTKWRRDVRSVVLDGALICEKECDSAAVASAVNERLGDLLEIQFPEPSETRTPGGYQASVQAQYFDHLEDVAFNEQPEDRVEVPGVRILLKQDGVKPGRTLIDLAGVEAEARYGISLLGGGAVEGGGTGDRDLDPLQRLGEPSGPVVGVPDTTGRPDAASPRGRRGRPGGGGQGTNPGELLLNGIGRFVDILPIWLTLLIPIYLSARRWLLLQRSAFHSGGRS